MDQAQLTTFGNHIRANTDPIVVAALAVGNLGDIRDWYNDLADFWVWKASVSTDQARDVIDWEEILTGAPITDLKRWAFDVMMADGTFEPERENDRVGLNKIFAGQPNTKAALLAISVEQATELVKLFAVPDTGLGGGDGLAQNEPAKAIVRGSASTADVDQALELTA